MGKIYAEKVLSIVLIWLNERGIIFTREDILDLGEKLEKIKGDF